MSYLLLRCRLKRTVSESDKSVFVFQISHILCLYLFRNRVFQCSFALIILLLILTVSFFNAYLVMTHVRNGTKKAPLLVVSGIVLSRLYARFSCSKPKKVTSQLIVKNWVGLYFTSCHADSLIGRLCRELTWTHLIRSNLIKATPSSLLF